MQVRSRILQTKVKDMIKYNIKLKTYRSIQPFSLTIPVKIVYYFNVDSEIVVPDFVFDVIDQIYMLGDTNMSYSVTNEIIRHRCYLDTEIYLKCESEVEYAKLKLKHEKI